MKFVKILLMVTCVLGLAACASNKTVDDPGAAYQGQTAEQIFTTGSKQLVKHNYDKAVKAFEGLDALYPFSPYAQKAQLFIIYAYYKNDDVPSTLAAADRYLQLYPLGPHDDYAYYMKGLSEFYANTGFLEHYFSTDYSQRNLAPLVRAFGDFNQLVHRYPNSPYAVDAQERMIYIRDIIAQYNLELAQFYYQRESYIGAINRANIVVQSYQGSPSVPDALIVIIQSDLKLGLNADAAKIYQVLKYNYPDNSFKLPM